MARPYWSGYLRFGLVSIPVRAVNAVRTGEGKVHFHQLHETCHSRIRYQKVCPIHGEVPNDEIVSGYEYEKGKYAIVNPEERAKLQDKKDESLHLITFTRPDELDPIYLDGRNYYLLPDTAGQRAYSVLVGAMTKQRRHAIGTIVVSKARELVLVRPFQELLLMEMLRYEANVNQPEAFNDELEPTRVPTGELKLAETLINASVAKRFDFGKFEDEYTERLTELIGEKVEDEEVVIPESEETAPPVINLLDALKKSVAKSKRPGPLPRKKSSKRPAAKHRRRGAG